MINIGRFEIHPYMEFLASTETAVWSGTVRNLSVFFMPDPSLERGAAILETARGNLDSSVDTQLREIERGFLDLVRIKR